MHFYSLSSISLLSLLVHNVHSYNDGPDYEHLPLDTVFPGPWESYIRAPHNKSDIRPSKIFTVEGPVSGGESVLLNAKPKVGEFWTIKTGGLVTFEFEENISGKVCFEVNSTTESPFLILAYSESPFFADRECDATGDYSRDLPLQFPIKHTGLNCVPPSYNRGGFKYLTVYIPENHVPSEGPYYMGGRSAEVTKSAEDERSFYEHLGQKILGQNLNAEDNSKNASVAISALWVNCTAFPSQPNGRAYTGYFDSSSSLLNRIWYAGAWTLQLSSIIPTEGGALIDFNRHVDHNIAPPGGWFANFTVAKGSVVTTDGAKRDRMVWPGDMTIAVPGIAMSTYDMLAIRNALDVIYDHQYSDGSMPYAGPPMGDFHEFSDTYHLHTLIGTYFYALFSGDLDWLKRRWPAYIKALGVSIGKVDETGLLHVSSNSDWNRWGMTGHNVEASSILFEVVGNAIKLASWIGKDSETETNGEKWSTTRERLQKGIYSLYCEQDGMFSDNTGRRGCNGVEKVLPQDGNGWVLLSKVFDDTSQASLVYNVSENLRSRWIKIGAPAVEFPNVMSPFSSSFELLGHTAARNPDAAVELMELMWGYMLDGPGMTNSTLIEGYRTDGYVHYPAYNSIARNSHAHGWSAGPTSVLIQGILGIQLKSPLGKEWHIEPQLTKWLSYARGGFATKLGKFEVSISLMRSLSTGRKVEALNVTVPGGTTGSVSWGGQVQIRTENMESTFACYRFLDAKTKSEKEWQTWSIANAKDLVKDITWTKPEVQERPKGVVDWEALEKGYSLPGKKFFIPSIKPNSAPNEDLRRQSNILDAKIAGLCEKMIGHRQRIAQFRKEIKEMLSKAEEDVENAIENAFHAALKSEDVTELSRQMNKYSTEHDLLKLEFKETCRQYRKALHQEKHDSFIQGMKEDMERLLSEERKQQEV